MNINRNCPAFEILFIVLLFVCLGFNNTYAASVSGPTGNQDRPGSDFFSFDLPYSEFEASISSANTCRIACTKHTLCRAYTYVKPGIQGPRARCYLKNRVPDAVADSCCSSGVRTGSSTRIVAVSKPDDGPKYFDVKTGIDRYGSDYLARELPAGSSASRCEALCAKDRQCQAFTYTTATASGGAPRCYLKSSQPPATRCSTCTSGVKLAASHVSPGTFGYSENTDLTFDPVRPLLVVVNNFIGPGITNTYSAAQTPAYYDQLIFGPNEPNISSYFYEASGGKFAFVKAGIIGPNNITTLPASLDAARTLAKRLAARNGIQYSIFDRDGDGTISKTELTILVIDNGSYGSAQTNENHCAMVVGQQNCAGTSLVGLNSGFDNIAHELAHTIEQWDNYGAAGTLGCLAQNLDLASCTVLGGPGPSQNVFNSELPDPWHRMYWGWKQPFIVSLSDPGGCTTLETLPGGGHGDTMLFFDPNRNTSEFFMAAYHNPAIPSFRQTNYMDPTGTNLLQRTLTYDDDFPGQGVLVWWVNTRNKTPFNIPVGIAAGTDNILQSTTLRGDDIFGPVVGGAPTVVAGPDGILQTPVNQRDVQLLDMTLIASYDPRTHRPSRWGTNPLLNNAETPVIRWFDGTVTGLRLRVPAVARNAKNTEIEWGSIRLRVDSIRPTRLRSSDRGFTVAGLFGVDNRDGGRQAFLTSRTTARVFRLEPLRWSCNSVTFRRPSGLASGDYDFEMRSRADVNSNQILLSVQ